MTLVVALRVAACLLLADVGDVGALPDVALRELSRPESWFDWSLSRLLCESALPPFAQAWPPNDPPLEPVPTTCTGPALPPVALPPLPPVVLVVWVLVAVLSCLHWSLPLVLPVASWLQTAVLLSPPPRPREMPSLRLFPKPAHLA